MLARSYIAAVVLVVLVGVLNGCDGEGSVTVVRPPDQPVGQRIGGQVLLPNGELARASSATDQLFAMLVSRVRALSAAVEPAEAGVEVQLVYVDPVDAADGNLPTNLPILDTALTNSNGQYELFLPVDTTVDRCRYMVQVGDAGDGTLTRAFVYSTDGRISFASETVVRQILAALADGIADDLCDFESRDIAALYQGVLNVPGTVSGGSVAAVNNNANTAVSADPGFQALLEDAALPGGLPPTRTATATVPAVATTTPTPTNTRAATSTETPRPTRTEGGATATRTATASVTSTRPATASPTTTSTPPVTATHTATTIPSPTATGTTVITVPVPTDTVAPTVTSTPVVTVSVPPATNTPTSTSTSTQVPSSTPTLPQGAALNLGNVSGAPGMIVSLPVMFVGTGIVAVSTDIEFDAASLDPVLVAGHPDCEAAPTLPDNKQVVTSVPSIPGLPAGRKVVRVGVVGSDNNDPLAGGTLFSCRFTISAGAPLGPLTLVNTPEGSDASGNAIVLEGTDGTVTVTAAPPSLDLDMVIGTVGENLTISATLHSRGQTISALSTDIAVGTAMLDIVLGGDQVPDCVVDDAIGAGTTPDKRIFAAVVPAAGTSTEMLRVGVIGTNNNAAIPDGAVFHCQLGVPGDATPGAVSLTHEPEGSSPTGMTVGLQGKPGQIDIVP